MAEALGVTDPPRNRKELTARLGAYRGELRATEEARAAARFILLHPPLPWAARAPYAVLATNAVAALPRWARTSLELPRLSDTAETCVTPTGRALTAAIRWHTDIPAVNFLFNEIDAGLPDMGGIETTVEKRERHRRALVRMLFQQFGSQRVAICLDPSALRLIQDFVEDKAATRVLLIDSDFDDDYVRGHIERVGLAGRHSAPDHLNRLIPAVRSDLEHEAERIRDLEIEEFETISRDKGEQANAAALQQLLGVTPEVAAELARTPNLFDD